MKRQRLTEKFAAAAGTAADKKKNNSDQDRNTEGFEYDKSKAKVLKKALHNINVSLGTLIAAMKELALIRGSEVTPDGKLGGRGFIMNFKDIKIAVNEAVSSLSDVTDTLADELTNPKWGLSKSEVKKVKKEQENVEDKVEDVTDQPSEKKKEITVEEKATEKEIVPGDVKDSADVDALKRYQEYVNGVGVDKTASVLSKNIMATILN
jgi:hypothetical protein